MLTTSAGPSGLLNKFSVSGGFLSSKSQMLLDFFNHSSENVSLRVKTFYAKLTYEFAALLVLYSPLI